MTMFRKILPEVAKSAGSLLGPRSRNTVAGNSPLKRAPQPNSQNADRTALASNKHGNSTAGAVDNSPEGINNRIDKENPSDAKPGLGSTIKKLLNSDSGLGAAVGGLASAGGLAAATGGLLGGNNTAKDNLLGGVANNPDLNSGIMNPNSSGFDLGGLGNNPGQNFQNNNNLNDLDQQIQNVSNDTEIKQKQKELQEAIMKNQAFSQQSQIDLAQKQKELNEGIMSRVSTLISSSSNTAMDVAKGISGTRSQASGMMNNYFDRYNKQFDQKEEQRRQALAQQSNNQNSF